MRALPLVLVVVSALAVSARSEAGPAPAVDGLVNVRPLDPTARLLLRFGYQHSPHFREIVHTLEASRTIVYVEVRHDGSNPVSGGLYFMSANNGRRWVRTRVDTGTSSPARAFQNVVHLTGILAHELQHAREAAEAPALGNLAEFERHFRQIGIKHPTLLDTMAAREAGRRVEAELRGGRPPKAPPAAPRSDVETVAAVLRQET
jgi:hypothetical protein